MAAARFRREFRFDDWANREVLRHLQRESQPPASCMRWFAHILGAQSVWLARMQQGTSSLAVWPTLTLDELEPHAARLREEWTGLLGGLDGSGLQRTIAYRNSRGEEHTSRIEDVLTHVLLHGAHHRGQIASALREEGLSAPVVDYIHAVRIGLVDE